ncbi:MAG: ABC transporter permease, partial [Candidatus Promineifilaceae bacterium]
MSLLPNWSPIITLTFKRLWAQKGLTAATLVGLIVGITLIMTVPLYANAVNFRILEEELGSQTERNNRPPFAYLYNYIGAWYEPVEWDAVQPITRYLRDNGAQTLGLPPEQFVWHIETNTYRLSAETKTLAQMRFATTSNLQTHIDITAGAWAAETPLRQDVPINVMMTAMRAEELGLAVGDSLLMRHPTNFKEVLPVQISGLWQPRDPADAYWFYAPSSFNEILIVPEATYAGRLAEQIPNEVYLGVWYWVLDGRFVGTGDVDQLVTGANAVERELERLLPNTQALQSPVESLQTYRKAVDVLTGQLLGFNAPTVSLVIAFISLVVGLAVGQRRNELAITRSRGGTAGQLIGIAALEGVILSSIAFVTGTLMAMWLTGQMGKVRSFLDFSAETQLRTIPNRATFIAGLIALTFAIIAQIIPTIFAASDTIITYKQNQARRRRPPWWQRTWLDVILFSTAAYGFYLLQNGSDLLGQTGGSVLESPILLMLPTVGILSVTLFFLRILPLVMQLLSRLLVFTNSISLLQASRYLARSTGLYATPLVLLTLTVSLSVFTASLARTFDLQLYDQQFYRVGADMNLLTTPNTSAQNRFSIGPIDISTDFYLPPASYEEIAGVQNATRVGRYPGNFLFESGREGFEFVGVERRDFPSVAYWR